MASRGMGSDGSAQPIPYALVVTVANDSPDLYNKIAQRYRTMLEPLRPVSRARRIPAIDVRGSSEYVS